MYTQLIQHFKTAQQAAAAAYAAVATAERDVFAEARTEYAAVQVRSEYSAAKELQDFCARLTSRLVREACGKFAPTTGRLEIDQAQELQRFGLDLDKVLRADQIPDLDGFWNHLESSFSGDAGKVVAFEQAAKAIINGFWLKPNSEIKRTSSAVVLVKHVYSETGWRSNGRRAVTYSSQTSVAQTMDALATFAGKHQFTALGMQLRNFMVSNLEFDTRDKVSFAGLEIVMFNDKWQFKFAHDVGDALSLFISEFGAEHLATRDRY